MFDIGLPNGFTADVASEIDRNNMAKMVDVDEDSLNIYYDSVSGTEENILVGCQKLRNFVTDKHCRLQPFPQNEKRKG